VNRSRSLVSRQSQRTGADFELVVCHRLRLLGCVEVEQVATPMRKVRGVWVRSAKVSCDVKAILPPSGRAVICECKLRPGGTLQWSDLADHQHRRLRNAADAGALAVVAFTDAVNGIELMDYGHALRLGFAPGARFPPMQRLKAAHSIVWPAYLTSPHLRPREVSPH